MKYVIVGRSGSGKTELASRLESKGLKVLKTYTTRRPRNDNDAKKYHFVSENDVDGFGDRILETEFFGARYFTRKTDLLAADAMVLEPDGFMEVVKSFPDVQFCLVYVKAVDPAVSDERAVARSDNPEAERAAIEKRRAGEDARFGPLEQLIETKDLAYVNCSAQVYENDFCPEHMDRFAANMTGKLRKNTNFLKVLTQLVALGALETSKENRLSVELDDGTHEVSLDVFAEMFVDDDVTFGYVVRSWMTHEIDFKIPGELAPDVMFAEKLETE